MAIGLVYAALCAIGAEVFPRENRRVRRPD